MVWTEAALMSLPDDGYRYELVDGELEASEVGLERGMIAADVSGSLRDFVRSVGGNTGFWLSR
jgi:hypothetical protein